MIDDPFIDLFCRRCHNIFMYCDCVNSYVDGHVDDDVDEQSHESDNEDDDYEDDPDTETTEEDEIVDMAPPAPFTPDDPYGVMDDNSPLPPKNLFPGPGDATVIVSKTDPGYGLPDAPAPRPNPIINNPRPPKKPKPTVDSSRIVKVSYGLDAITKKYFAPSGEPRAFFYDQDSSILKAHGMPVYTGSPGDSAWPKFVDIHLRPWLKKHFADPNNVDDMDRWNSEEDCFTDLGGHIDPNQGAQPTKTPFTILRKTIFDNKSSSLKKRPGIFLYDAQFSDDGLNWSAPLQVWTNQPVPQDAFRNKETWDLYFVFDPVLDYYIPRYKENRQNRNLREDRALGDRFGTKRSYGEGVDITPPITIIDPTNVDIVPKPFALRNNPRNTRRLTNAAGTASDPFVTTYEPYNVGKFCQFGHFFSTGGGGSKGCYSTFDNLGDPLCEFSVFGAGNAATPMMLLHEMVNRGGNAAPSTFALAGFNFVSLTNQTVSFNIFNPSLDLTTPEATASTANNYPVYQKVNGVETVLRSNGNAPVVVNFVAGLELELYTRVECKLNENTYDLDNGGNARIMFHPVTAYNELRVTGSKQLVRLITDTVSFGATKNLSNYAPNESVGYGNVVPTDWKSSFSGGLPTNTPLSLQYISEWSKIVVWQQPGTPLNGSNYFVNYRTASGAIIQQCQLSVNSGIPVRARVFPFSKFGVVGVTTIGPCLQKLPSSFASLDVTTTAGNAVQPKQGEREVFCLLFNIGWAI